MPPNLGELTHLADDLGFKGGKVLPFNPFKNKFIVYPLAIMDICFMVDENRWEKFDEIVKTIDNNNGLLVINWHQRVFNEDEFPDYIESYKTIIEKLKLLNSKFCTLSEYYNENVGNS